MNFAGTALVLIFIFTGSIAMGSVNKDRTLQKDTLNIITYRGVLKDARSNDELPFAAVEAVGSNIATVTNLDGEFTIKIHKDSDVKMLKFSYLGFNNKIVPLSEFKEKRDTEIELQPVSTVINELTIRPVSGSDFIDEVLNKVAINYQTEPQMMNGFYRETIKKGWSYVAISEAVVEIFKSGYDNPVQFDQVRIDKGRKSANVEKMDTILFKLKGGPAVLLLLDIVKNPYILLTEEYSKIFDFKLANVVSLNERLHYVVEFSQFSYITDPYYYGRLYIDMDNLAISEVEFSLNLENEEEASRLFVQKKPMGMSVIPEKATYRSSYVNNNGKWYFNYARGEVKFKVDWDKKLFNSNYTIMTEIAITDRKQGGAEKIQFRERFKKSEFLDEMVYVFFEPDYWGEYNVIEPDQSIESAIRKLNRKFDNQ